MILTKWRFIKFIILNIITQRLLSNYLYFSWKEWKIKLVMIWYQFKWLEKLKNHIVHKLTNMNNQ